MVFALLLKPVAVEESEEIEEVLLGKRTHEAALFFLPSRLCKHALCILSAAICSLLKIVCIQPKPTMSAAEDLFSIVPEFKCVERHGLRSKCAT